MDRESSGDDYDSTSSSPKTVSHPLQCDKEKLFIGNLPPYTKECDIKRHILEHCSDIDGDFIISAFARTTKKYCHGTVTVSCCAEDVIQKIHGTIMKGCKIKVRPYESSRKRTVSQTAQATANDHACLKESSSQVNLTESQEVNVIAVAIPPLTEEIPHSELMEHFTHICEHIIGVKCFKCFSRPYFKVRLKFPSLDKAKTAIIRMNGISFGEHKLKFQLENRANRRYSLPATSVQPHKGTHSLRSVLTPNLDLQVPCSMQDAAVSISEDSTAQTSKKGLISCRRKRSSKSRSSRVLDRCSSNDGDKCHTLVEKNLSEMDKTRLSVPYKQCNPKQTKVIFRSTYVVTKPTFQAYMEHHVSSLEKKSGREIAYEIVSVCSLHEGVEIQVLFSSQNQAKQVLHELVCHDPNIVGHIAGKTCPTTNGFEQKRAIQDFRASITSKTKKIAEKYQVKITQLRDELKTVKDKYPKKKLSLELFGQLEIESKPIEQKITECERQYIEFNIFCDKLHQQVQVLEVDACITSMETISRTRKSFGRECNRFMEGLPMYAYREDIVKTILESTVTIIVGETGSGKSTQLVQYLYEAGLGSNGIIACTQPRKVAAISLAKHVSTEMGVTLGHEFGYKIGLRGKYSSQTRVFYMTDHTLLNECIADTTFSMYSCLIIDEAHERSLSTDLLLAFIKQCLPSRPDLKVVITSATIDPELFVRYFGGNCPVVKVPGRAYPVDVIYCDNEFEISSDLDFLVKRDYVKDSVEQACKLHQSEPVGDFVVFLTSAVEIERACQLTSNKLRDSAVILPLHGKLQPEDQQKVFKEYNKRKIVFSTNVAETSVTIPGVKCIVDTGLAKELCFDPKKNMNSLEVRLISKSSAEQRKGRAGRTSAGKCYRLYSEDVYSRMPKKSLPEILRVTLASTVLKLYEFGVTDVLGFEFVEEPDRVTLEVAEKSLKFLGAIEDGHLTELGKKMAALPIDPHHSKIMFDGIDKGVGLEAATAVTISTLAGGVFFRAGNNEVKSESDMKTIQFSHPSGDQIAYLHTYYEWTIQKPNEQSRWCVKNFVNAKSMKMVKETLHELRDILNQQFNIVLPNIYDLKKAEEIIPKLYYNTFIWHLSIYLGHEAVGYLNERYPHHQFVVFPGSPLRQLNKVPELLIYEKTLVTTQHFLLQVLPVREEWIQESIQLGVLEHHPFDSHLFCHLSVHPLTINNLGPHVLSTLRKWIEKQKIATAFEVKPAYEYLPDRGQLKVFLQMCHHATVHQLLQDQIDRIKSDLLLEVYECGVSEDNNSICIVAGTGGLVKHILMPDEYRTVVIKAHKDECSLLWPEELIHELSTCGRIEKHDNKIFSHEKKLFVTFYQPEDAVKAIELISEHFKDVTIQPRNFAAQNRQQFSLQLEWNRRKRENYAFIVFINEENLAIAEQQLCNKLDPMRFVGGVHAIKYQMDKDGRSLLYASNVNTSLTAEQIKQHILSRLPMMDDEDLEVNLGYQKSFETPQHKVDQLKRGLHDILTTYTRKDQYSLSMIRPQNQHRTFKARVQFNTIAEGQRVFTSLQNHDIDGCVLEIKPLLSSVLFYSAQVHSVISELLSKTMKDIEDAHPSVNFSLERGVRNGIKVRVTSDDINTFMTARRLLEEAVGPLSVDCSDRPVLREFIGSRSCREMVWRIKSKTSTFVYTDYQSSSVKIYGARENMEKAYEEVIRALSVLEYETQYYEIPLKTGRPPGLMKHLISLFGPGLNKFKAVNGVTSIYLNPSRQMLTVFASEKAFDTILEAVNQCSVSLDTDANAEQNEHCDLLKCCVCYGAIKSSADIFNLEYCGHAYCRECISLQVAPNALSFPVECAADQCSKPFVWKDFSNLSLRIGLEMPSFVSASLRSYVAANPNLVHYCPTPDCPVIYKVTSDKGENFLCTHCGVSTCTKCHDTYHEDITCEQYKDSKEKNEELEVWMEKKKSCRKRCPKCNIPIEKNKGCNHIHCRQCSADICWVCLKYFTTPRDCYDHLHDVHKGLWDPQ